MWLSSRLLFRPRTKRSWATKQGKQIHNQSFHLQHPFSSCPWVLWESTRCSTKHNKHLKTIVPLLTSHQNIHSHTRLLHSAGHNNQRPNRNCRTTSLDTSSHHVALKPLPIVYYDSRARRAGQGGYSQLHHNVDDL